MPDLHGEHTHHSNPYSPAFTHPPHSHPLHSTHAMRHKLRNYKTLENQLDSINSLPDPHGDHTQHSNTLSPAVHSNPSGMTHRLLNQKTFAHTSAHLHTRIGCTRAHLHTVISDALLPKAKTLETPTGFDDFASCANQKRPLWTNVTWALSLHGSKNSTP